jgi:hypothetical protein
VETAEAHRVDRNKRPNGSAVRSSDPALSLLNAAVTKRTGTMINRMRSRDGGRNEPALAISIEAKKVFRMRRNKGAEARGTLRRCIGMRMPSRSASAAASGDERTSFA